MTTAMFLDTLASHRAIAILRSQHMGRAVSAMEAAVSEGFRVLQFSSDAAAATELISEFSRRPGLVIGVGDVLDVAAIKAAAAAGARFVASPVNDSKLAAGARDHGVALLLGGYSPTEMVQAHHAGAACQTLHPAVADIPEYLRAVLGPLPFLRIVPTDGVHGGNAAAILAAGATGIGFTTSLFNPLAIEARQFGTIRENARALLASIKHFAYAGRRRPSTGL
jgi:2-dehydro-3-deoxyphosphogluconate aldolase/(4S)-4-hydroxy-2-oxoglutarate aldolase